MNGILIRRRLMLCGFLAVLLLADPGLSHAQTTSDTPTAEKPSPKAPLPQAGAPGVPPAAPEPLAPNELRPSKPDVYYLRDKEGRLVPVPDFTYEDFKRLYDLDKRFTEATAPPQFVLQHLAFVGKADDRQASLRCDVRVLVKSDQWVRIPLRLSGVALAVAPRYDGPGSFLLELDEDGEDFVAWLRERDSQPHTISLELLVPVRSIADGHRITLPVPAATTSELKLTVAGRQVAASTGNGATLLGIKPQADQRHEIHVAGLTGDSQLSWTDSGKATGPVSSTLEASSNVTVRIEGPQRITSEARLKVRSYGVPLESFRVRLPIGMDWFPLNEPGYRVIPVAAGGGEPGAGSVVEVVPDVKNSFQVEVRLRAVLPAQARAVDEPIETLGFEVIGAVRQFGQVECMLEGDWAVSWPERLHVQPLEVSDAARTQRVAARFEFYRQPCSLKVQVQPRQTRIGVEPTYLLSVEAQRVRLEAILRYKVRGPSAERVVVDLPDWKVERVEPEALVREEAFQPGKTQPLTIPLSTDASNLREFELRIQASHEIPADADSLVIALPKPEANFASPARLVVLPADNVAVTPRLRDMPGVVAQPPPKDIELPGRQQTPLAYELRGDEPHPRFAANLQRRQRSLSVSVQSTIRLESDRVQVEQRLSYRITNEPIRQIPLALGRELIERNAVQVFLERDDRELVPLPLAPPTLDADAPATVVVTADCPQDLIGAVELLVRYDGLWAGTRGGLKLEPWRVPLGGPAADANTRITGYRLRVVPPPLAGVELADSQWIVETDSLERVTGRELLLAASGPVDGVTLRGATTFSRANGETLVTKAWIQTWLGGDVRQDRLALRLRSSESQLIVQLPADAHLDDVVAALDGQATTPAIMQDGRVRLEFADQDPVRERLVELSYLAAWPGGSSGTQHLEFPQVLGAANVQRLYWQLVVPSDEYLLATPSPLVPDAQWVWTLGILDRQSRLSQLDLERWVGAVPQTALPADTNEYLYSAFGSLRPIDVRLISRGTLVLIVSGLVLAVSLLLVYVPALRHPSLLLVAAVATGAIFWWLPAMTIVLIQAGVIGLMLGLLGRILQGLTLRRQVSRGAMRPSGISALESKATEVRIGRPDSVYHATTATAPPPSAMPAAVPKV